MSHLRRGRAITFSGLGALLLVTTACELPTQAPTVDSAQFAKGGGGPAVEGAIPAEGAQGAVNLQVRVLGSGFDNGSNAVWLRDGSPAPDVTTNSTSYVSKTELIADITIDAAALETLYDIEVTTRRGKKGVGVELFSVKKPGEVAPTFSVEMTQLGQFEGISSAQSITSEGGPIQVVGYSRNLEDRSQSFVWHMTLGGAPTALTCSGPGVGWCEEGASGGRGVDVNSGGSIVASQRTYNAGADYFYGRAAYWDDPSSASKALPEPSYPDAIVVSGVNDISNTGYAAGYVVTSTDPSAPSGSNTTPRAVLWYNDPLIGWTVRDLHAEFFEPLGASGSQAYVVNDQGVVAGFGWVLQDEVLLTLPGPGDRAVLSMNDATPIEIAGAFQNTPDGDSPAVVWTLAGAQITSVELPYPGQGQYDGALAIDINQEGHVVGSASSKSDSRTAVLWVKDASAAGGYWPVDLGSGRAWGIDDATLADDGIIRIVGETTVSEGKGRKATTRTVPVLWTVTRTN